jgi:hypothetical protein
VKTLILTDERWTTMVLALDATPAGRDLLDSLGAEPELPDGAELRAVARAGGEPPDAIKRARAYRDAGRQAAVDTRETMNELVRYAYEQGVRPVVLARWFGLKPTRIYEITEGLRAT